MEKLNKEQLQDLIIILEKSIFELSRQAEIHSVIDSRLISAREALRIAREELGKRCGYES